MSDVAIRVEGVSKQYRIGKIEQYRTLRDSLTEAVTAPFRRMRSMLGGPPTAAQTPSETIWALKDVSFDVKHGEAIGIIGRNGAGKSTLLKVLSRITEPTAGQAAIHGRVGSLLEVGTGFHNELTGRENIYLNGAILGMKKAEIHRKFDAIVAFAEVDKFIDTPVKHYSSGMYVRLAFAVAAHLDPEILIVDEVLAVGDAAFQQKCLGKLSDVATGQGRTVLFVSHNMQAIGTLCTKTILLTGGKVEAIGATRTVVDSYLRKQLALSSNLREQSWPDLTDSPGNDSIRIRRLAVVPQGPDPNVPIDIATPFRVEVDYWNLVPGTSIIMDLCVYALDGSPVFESLSTREERWHGREFPRGLFRSVCYVPGNLLNEGSYALRIIFVSDKILKLFDYVDAATITLTDGEVRNIPNYDRFIGHVRPLLPWTTELLQQSSHWLNSQHHFSHLRCQRESTIAEI